MLPSYINFKGTEPGPLRCTVFDYQLLCQPGPARPAATANCCMFLLATQEAVSRVKKVSSVIESNLFDLNTGRAHPAANELTTHNYLALHEAFLTH